MSLPDADRFNHVVRLIRVATGLEAEGWFGANKLAHALAESLLIREAQRQGIPRTGAGLEEELDRVIEDLMRSGSDPEIVRVFEAARIANRENRGMRREELGEVNVCRTCGEVMLGTPPANCPNCGADGLLFHAHPPVFYLEPLPPAKVLAALQSAPDVISALMAGLSDEQMTTRPAPGEWSMHELVWHLYVTQELLAGRVDRILAEDNPSLAGVASWAVSSADAPPMRELMARYRESRGRTVGILEDMPFEGWFRTGVHGEFGPVTILQQASYFAKHERSHLPQFRDIRRAVAG